MTDLETMREMLKRAEIDFEESDQNERFASVPEGEGYRYSTLEPKRLRLRVERGYSGFYSIFTFDLDGKLINLEAYE